MKAFTPQNVRNSTALRDQFRKRHIEVARAAISDVERRQGIHPRVTVVDGVRGKREEAVKTNGQIVYLIDAVKVATQLALDMVRVLAPEDEGDFKRSFVTLVDGVEAPVSTARAGAEITLINTQPYSRRLEFGWSLQAPNGVFEVTAKALKQLRKDVFIRFDYVPLEGFKRPVPAIIIKSKVF